MTSIPRRGLARTLVIVAQMTVVWTGTAGAAQVPDVLHRPVGEARDVVEASGYRVELEGGDPAPSGRLAYTVQLQNPDAGRQAPLGAVVTLRIFAKPFDPAVPNVTGLSVSEAQTRLAAAGLGAVLLGGDPAPPTAAPFTVQSQRPLGAASDGPGNLVELLVFGPSEKITRTGPHDRRMSETSSSHGAAREPNAVAVYSPPDQRRYVFDVLATGITAHELATELGLAATTNQGGVEVFRAQERGIAHATVWYDAERRLRWARVQLIRSLPLEVAVLLFDIHGDPETSQGHPISGQLKLRESTCHYLRDGVHFYIHDDVVEEIWITSPGEGFGVIAAQVDKGLL